MQAGQGRQAQWLNQPSGSPLQPRQMLLQSLCVATEAAKGMPRANWACCAAMAGTGCRRGGLLLCSWRRSDALLPAHNDCCPYPLFSSASIQGGDPTGTGRGGTSIYVSLSGCQPLHVPQLHMYPLPVHISHPSLIIPAPPADLLTC